MGSQTGNYGQCPTCGASIDMELEDTYVLDASAGRYRFSKRLAVCSANCGWHAVAAGFYPHRDNPQMVLSTPTSDPARFDLSKLEEYPIKE